MRVEPHCPAAAAAGAFHQVSYRSGAAYLLLALRDDPSVGYRLIEPD
jgi:hypothetical protein